MKRKWDAKDIKRLIRAEIFQDKLEETARNAGSPFTPPVIPHFDGTSFVINEIEQKARRQKERDRREIQALKMETENLKFKNRMLKETPPKHECYFKKIISSQATYRCACGEEVIQISPGCWVGP